MTTHYDIMRLIRAAQDPECTCECHGPGPGAAHMREWGCPNGCRHPLRAADALAEVSSHDGATYGPCHLCGSESPERHGVILVGCCRIEGSTRTATVEICEPCRSSDLPCPHDDVSAIGARPQGG